MFNKSKLKAKKILLKVARINSYSIAASKKNNETFLPFKDCLKGKSVVMCGAGPTLSKYIPLDNVVHFALNRALLLDKVKYDYFIADDWAGISFLQNELENYDCVKFFGHQVGCYEREIPETFARKCKARRYYTDSFLALDGFDSTLISDIDLMPIGNMPNIALSALQIIMYMNPDKIYLVGCDASGSSHYKEDNVSKELRKLHKKDLELAVTGERVLKTWEKLKEFANTYYPDVEINSINPVGLKGLFNDYAQNDNGELVKLDQ